MIFCQITKNFDEVMALASAPRPDQPRRIYFEKEYYAWAKEYYDKGYVVDNLKSRDPDSPHLAYSDALHVILAVFQNQPLSMEFIAMKKVLADDLELKGLPQGLKLKAEEVN